MDFIISPLTTATPQAHINQVTQLIWEAWGEHYNNSYVSLEKEVKYCIDNNTASYLFYAYIKENNEVCGSIGLLENDLDMYPNIEPWLANFYVLPKYRDLGIGRALYQYTVNEAFKKLNYNSIYLYTENPVPYQSKNWILVEEFEYKNAKQYLLKLTQV